MDQYPVDERELLARRLSLTQAAVEQMRLEVAIANHRTSKSRRRAEQLEAGGGLVGVKLRTVRKGARRRLGRIRRQVLSAAQTRSMAGRPLSDLFPANLTRTSAPVRGDAAGGRVPEAFRDLLPSPLTQEYRNLVAERQPPEPGSRSIAFCVWSTELRSGRGDLYVAAGLARALRRSGWRTSFFAKDQWDLVTDGIDVVVAMVPQVDPCLLPGGSFKVAWMRSYLEDWVERPESAMYDLWLAVSEVAATELAAHTSTRIEVLPIGVDPDLFAPDPEVATRIGVVSSVNDFGSDRALLRHLRGMGPVAPLVLFGARPRRAPVTSLTPHEAGLVEYTTLPSAYARAMVVLDDQLPGARSLGSMNSRVYEAAAAGAIPLSNGRPALEGAGLDFLPTWSGRESLEKLLTELAEPSPAAVALGQRAREVVLDRHTFGHRAQRFTEIVVPLLEGPSDARSGSAVDTWLGFFPDYRIANPYQSMLYEGAISRGYLTTPCDNPGIVDPALMGGDHDKKRILHVHWTNPIVQSARTEDEAMVRAQLLAARFERFKQAGGRIVWTVHNVIPHELNFEDAELVVLRTIARLADVVHVMCEQTAVEVESFYQLPHDRLLVVPHASYVGWYPDGLSREAARARLGLSPDTPVVLLFGGFRPYKGVDVLLDALDDPEIARRGVVALIAGKPHPAPETRELIERCQAHPRVRPEFAYIPDKDLQVYYKAADVSVLPYRRTLNSGALMASISFGTPVIAPHRGCLPSMVDDSCATLFDPDDPQGFLGALRDMDRLCTPAVRRAARARAEERLSSSMSRAFFDGLAAHGL